MSDTAAIENGTPIRKEFLQFCKASIGEEEINEVINTLKSGWLTTGPRCLDFEEEMKKYTKCKEAIAVNSCTAGAHILLKALNINQGDEVISTPMTFTSMVNNILHLKAKPIFSDVKETDINLDPDLLNDKITKNTKVIIATHYAGLPCDMDKINSIAKDNNLVVIEDAAHSIGSTYKGKHTGTISDAGVYSFYATKNITTGEGGMILTDNEELANKSRMLRLHGISKDAWKRYTKEGSWYYEVVDLGYKYNMTDIQAALGLVQLKKLEYFKEKRRTLVEYYKKSLADIDEVSTLKESEGTNPCWHIFPIKLDASGLKISKQEFMQALIKENIGISLHFIPLHLQPLFRNTLKTKEGDFPVAEKVYQQLISLPLYPEMTNQDIDDVANAIKKLINLYRK